MPDDEFRARLMDITARLDRIETAISGYKGQNGLMKKVEDVCLAHNKLKQSFWILLIVLAGSGILGVGSILAALR